MISPYVVSEVARNLPRLPAQAPHDWTQLRPALVAVRDVWIMDRPAVFGPAKDCPVLFTVAAWAEALLTLDRDDFGAVMGTGFLQVHPRRRAGELQGRQRCATRRAGAGD